MGVVATENEIVRDQRERDGLTKAIADAETALAVSAPGTRLTLQNFVEQAKGRVAVLEKKITDAIKEREVEANKKAAAVATLAAKEAALSEKEKETYSGFLSKEFFTKKDFGKLEDFYAHSWDRLSEGGKEEMSHRLWEGIRRHEYEFANLPKSVQEKEAKLAYRKLADISLKQGSLAGISEADRSDFLAAYRSGNQKEVNHILSRESFAQNMALKPSRKIDHKAVDSGKEVEDQAAVAATRKGGKKIGIPPPASAVTAQFNDIDLDAVKLKDAVLAEVSAPPSPASIPDASGSRVVAR